MIAKKPVAPVVSAPAAPAVQKLEIPTQVLEQLPPPPPPPVMVELTAAQKAAKEKLENPTVDENGEHIMTVEEAK